MNGNTKHVSAQAGDRNPNRRARAFTLIEMLVVIAIIGILAGLTLAALPAVKAYANRRAVKTELKQLETVIGRYKAQKSVFPPDNPNDPKQPPLFYELTGTLQDLTNPNNPLYKSIHAEGDAPLTKAQIQSAFGIDGFLNSAPEREEVRNFFDRLLPSRIREISGVKVLTAPYKGQDGQLAPWYYNSSNPTHNPGEYDLWAEINIGGETEIIGNW